MRQGYLILYNPKSSILSKISQSLQRPMFIACVNANRLLKGLKLLSFGGGGLLFEIVALLPKVPLPRCPSRCRSLDSFRLSLNGLRLSVALLPLTGGLACSNLLLVLRLLPRSLNALLSVELCESMDEYDSLLRFFSDSESFWRGGRGERLGDFGLR